MTKSQVLEAGIHAYIEGDYARPVGSRWRKDGEPSKHDRCPHEVWMYEDCFNCAVDHFEDLLLKAAKEGDN